MTYNSFLDTYFSSYWLLVGVPAALFILLIVLVEIKSKKRKIKYFIKFIIYAIPVLLLFTAGIINTQYLGYGKPDRINDIQLINGKLYVIDAIKTIGTKISSSSEIYRVHIIDPSTGEKIMRFMLGYKGELICVRGDSLAFSHRDDITFYSIKDGHEYCVWSKETLSKQFSELSSGVDNLIWSGGKNPKMELLNQEHPIIGTNSLVLEVKSLDGKNWILNPMNGKIIPDQLFNNDVKYKPTNKLYVSDDVISIDDSPVGKPIFELCGNDDQKQICKNQDVLNNGLTFLKGKFVAVNEKDSFFLVMHYVTTKQQQFIITSISLDGMNKLWEIKQSSLDKDKSDDDALALKPSFAYDNKNGLAYVSLKDAIVCIKTSDGSIVWQSSL
jgi:hypothetical protein